ncbi:MAG: hypothetical protein LBJ35_05605 [Spirochaetaceae bacterium]|jgi:hypothetical protein|nr:hypothetical protein [Spirochaetaceae bacterium]
MKQTGIIFILLIFLSSCGQDPIFTMIANEVKPKDPIINGSPSKLTRSGGDIYTANGKLWKYSNGWSQVGNTPPNVYDIAAGGSGLYLLSMNGSDTSVYALNGGKIENPTGYNMIQGLYSDGSSVFAGAEKSGSDEYAILSINGNSFSVKQTIGSPLTGIAGPYFATAINGVYNGSTLVPGTSGYSIAGIINAEGTVIAVTGNGKILEFTGSGVTVHESSSYPYFTGALAIYKNKGNTLLLLGSKSGIYDLGYREMKLDGKFELFDPGSNAPDSTVSDRDKYRATLAKCAVNSLMQLSDAAGGGDGLPVIFASTQKDGIWAYRDNEWNAEE